MGRAMPHVKRSRRWPRRTLVAVNALVLVMLVAAGSAYAYVSSVFDNVHHISVKGLTYTPVSSAMTILAVGSDTRNLGAGNSAAFGNDSTVTGQRSDTIMLIRVVPATSSVAILSIPRDLLVPIAGMGTTRVNAAFNSGPNLLVQTLTSDLGIKINHFIVLNFYTFTKIADSLGGVYQYFPAPARDAYSLLNVPAGCVLLKGANALGFVRSRHYEYYLDGSWQYQLVPESDLGRIERQQDFIKLALKKAEHTGLTNLGTLSSVITGIASSLTVDSNFSTSLMFRLAATFRHTNVNGIANWTYPTVNSVEVPGALDPVPSEDEAMISQFLHYGLPSSGGSPSTTTVASATRATATADAAPAGPSASATTSADAQVAASLALDVWTAAAPSGGLTTPNDEISPDSSSYYHGQYIPPGRVPGQVPETCPN